MSKTIVVVGASRGIGKAVVEQFAANSNYRVFALARNKERLISNFKEFPNVVCGAFDLASHIAGQLAEIFEDKGKIDILINNAGYLVNKPFETITHEDFHHSYQVNVIGVMETVQYFVPKMNTEKSHIVNISSMGGFQGSMKFAGLAAYSTSKAALCSFTELFAEEYKNTEIKMNCLCLGAVQTEMLEEAFPGYKAPLEPKEMAKFIVNFAETNGYFMNGKIIPVSLSNP
ncbi:MAG: SDR family oxidoreductase [Bacteroidetes bacterium]|nr:SDR family oxidoreductase [Bacteroidota bacterium]